MSDWVTRHELAERWRCSVRTIDRMLADGALPHVRVRSRVLFRRTDIEAWETASQRNGARKPAA